MSIETFSKPLVVSMEKKTANFNGEGNKRDPTQRNRVRPWHYSCLHLCADCTSCFESWFCWRCQLSRQMNFIYYNKSGINCSCLMLFLCLDFIFGCMPTYCLAVHIRNNIRERYNISGNLFCDMLCVYLFGPCTLQQQLLELTSLGENPGTTLCSKTPKIDVMV